MMKQSAVTAVALAVAFLAAASCGRNPEQPPTHDTPVTAAPAASPARPLQITFRTDPEPPKSGETVVDVTIYEASGQPVTDAAVSAEFYMPAMPDMKMAEMRNTIPLSHEAAGRYRGKGNIMMAGKWDVTVTVKRQGQEVGRRTLSITAQ